MKILEWPELAVFDLDDTLYDYPKCNSVALNTIIIEISQYANLQTSEISRALEVARSVVKERLGFTASSHSRILYISEAFRQLRLLPDVEMFVHLEQVYWDTFLFEMEIFPGVESFIHNLRKRSIQLALVTDLTSTIQYRKIDKLNLNCVFDVIITSEEAGGDKSTGKPFSLLEHISGGKISKAWFFGDSYSDHPIQGTSGNVFFKKTNAGEIIKNSNSYEYGDYSRLQKELFTSY